jgi:Na+/H+ antiporter NhaD/arsenite permease-like protein
MRTNALQYRQTVPIITIMLRHWFAAVIVCLADASIGAAAEHVPLDLPAWSVIPFAILLLCIAILPLAAEHWWHKNRNKAIVSVAVAVPAIIYLAAVQFSSGQPALPTLAHEMFKYISFIILLGSLFIVSGGIVLHGDFAPKPWTNVAFLAVGAVVANVIGTTGASVLLIRPLLRINKPRRNAKHLPVFFVFIVSNVGGLLTPLGDPPLFLGFLNGVPFTWTLTLWREWLLVNGLVLMLFFVLDFVAYRSEPADLEAVPPEQRRPVSIEGLLNLPLLAGVIIGVLIQGMVPGTLGEALGAAIMLSMGALSLWFTPAKLRQANGFSWSPIIEVAVLFFGIFVAMVPALELLKLHGKELGITEPWQYFWITGGLSAFLDNAPTYLALATMAAQGGDIGALASSQPLLLVAISTGAVFMGAMTYIGNGPNFMVKAIAEEAGFKMPTFFGYLGYSCLCLVPVYLVVTWVFF